MTAPSGNHRSNTPPEAKKASFWHLARIVISMLFMIGRNRDYGPNAPVITPARLIIASVIGAVLLVGGLVMLASSITH
jgi:hypothetical protein